MPFRCNKPYLKVLGFYPRPNLRTINQNFQRLLFGSMAVITYKLANVTINKPNAV
jgi:hypothetical protein